MLDQFRAQKLEWNRANNQIYDRVETNSGDSNGRTLFVQISNGGTVEDLTGATLSLAWSKRTEQGLESFEEVDAKKGQYRLFYPTGMLVNHGVLQASLVLVDVTGRIESKPFDIIVHKGTVDDEAVESDNKFTALTTALVKVSQVQAEFDGLYADKSQMMDTLHDDKKADMEVLEADYSNRANTLEATYAPRLTEVGAQLAQTEQSLNAQLAEKAKQTDLVLTNNAVASKSERSYVDAQLSSIQDKIIGLASAKPSGVYSSLVDLQTAFPTGNSNIYLISANGNWYYWNKTTLAWTSGGVYQATSVAKDSVTNAMLKPDFALNGQIANNADLNSVIKDGNHFGINSGGYTNLPPQFNPLRSFCLNNDNLTSRWAIQRLTDFSQPTERYVRLLDKTGTGTSAWVRDSYTADGSITRIKLGNNPLTNPAISNNTDIFTIQKEGRYLGIGGVSYNYTNVPEALKNVNGVQKTFLLDVAVYGETGSFIIQTIYDAQKPSRCFYNYNQGTTNSGGQSVNGLPPDKTILFFGDSITENGDYPERVALKIGMRAINVGFGGCRMAQHAPNYDPFSMYRLVDYIKNENFSGLMAAAEELNTSAGDNNIPIVQRLIDVDFSKVDIIVIGYGTNDYGGNIPIGTNDDADGTTFKGAINKTISTLLTKYPHIKIMFNTPFYRNRWESVSDGLDGDTYANSAGHKLQDYVDALVEIGEIHHVPVFNLMSESGINKYNQSAYLADGLHPINPSGYEHLASKVASKIKSSF
ncbi:GDSL-type esterase/lipase family protein [Jeotgalibaca porci]|uniref:GDSL-type esterase/lipase family protein n=1 Tax=Jeotgalibaca porci TaxID=1868793 RepID=UPI0035A110F9